MFYFLIISIILLCFQVIPNFVTKKKNRASGITSVSKMNSEKIIDIRELCRMEVMYSSYFSFMPLSFKI